MAFLQVYFNGELKFTAPLQQTETRIGRAADNNIVIDNRGVSGHHAIIVRNADEFYIGDNNSTNGVFVNGRRISESRLFYGDEITIFKHKLKFVAVNLSAAESSADKLKQNAIVEDKTVFVHADHLKTIVQQQRTPESYLQQTGGKNHGQRWLLSEQNFEIGSRKDCNLYISGWFAPRLSAIIIRQSDGYYLIPKKRGKVHLNNQAINEQNKLENHDRLKIRGLSLTFNQTVA